MEPTLAYELPRISWFTRTYVQGNSPAVRGQTPVWSRASGLVQGSSGPEQAIAFADRPRVEPAVIRREAAARGQVELPAVELTGEYAILDPAELGEITPEVRAAALDHVAVALPELLYGRTLRVVALDVLHPLHA